MLEIRHTQRGNVVHMEYDVDGAEQEQINTMMNTRNIIDNNMSRLAEIIVRMPVFHQRNFIKYRFVECRVGEMRNNFDQPHFEMIGAPHRYHMKFEISWNYIYHDYQRLEISRREAALPGVLGLGSTFRHYRLEGAARNLPD